MLGREYIVKIFDSAQLALERINKDDDQLTVLDIQKALGELDKVEHDLEAAKILLREELKERRLRE